MANLTHNISKGRLVELADRARRNADASGALIVIPWNSTDTDDAVRDADSVAALEALAATVERTAGGWNRKSITDAAITVTIDDTANQTLIDIADQTWTAVAAGNNTTDLGIGYDADTAAGTDSDIAAGTWHDWAITTDGSDVTAQIAAGGFLACA